MCTATLVLLLSSGSSRLFAQDPQPLPVTKGAYRLPYQDGTTVRFSNNHLSHPSSLNKIDMAGQPSGGAYTVVSAAAGWVRIIVEDNFTACPNACGSSNDCDGDGATSAQDNEDAQSMACDTYTGNATSCCERDYANNGGVCPNGGTCTSGPNNFVWIEHPNGEWTKYSHMQTNSTGPGGAGRFVGEFIGAGTPIGLEGDIGFASGPHVHFEAAVLNYVELQDQLDMDNAFGDADYTDASVADWFTSGGFVVSDNFQDDVIVEDKDGDGFNDPDDDVNRQNRIAVFCQVGFPVPADQRTAGVCDDLCGSDSFDLLGTITPALSPFYQQATNTVSNSNGAFVIQPFAGVSVRAGSKITLLPGFHAEEDSFFVASIGACDSPGGTGN